MSSSSDFFAALRYRDFSLLSLNQLCLTLAILIQEVVVAYSLYQITKNPLMLGLIGLVELVPFIVLSLWGGYIADYFNRQTILKLGFALTCPIPACLALLFFLHAQQSIELPLFLLGVYGCIFVLGLLRGIYSPSFNSLRPFLVPEKIYSNANTWTALIWQIGAMLGPLLAGVMMGQFGIYIALSIALLLLCVGSGAVAMIGPRCFPAVARQPMIQSMQQAIQFMLNNRMIFWSMLLDLSTVLFGALLTLLPIFAEEILKSGASGLGLLRAAPAIGTLCMTFALMRYDLTQHAWRNMLVATLGFGLCAVTFACSRSLVLSFVLLIGLGAFDSMSMIIRQTLLQLLPSKSLLGRVAALNGIIVTSGNQIGAFQASLFARLWTVVPATLVSGGACLMISLAIGLSQRDLLKSKIKQHKHTFLTSHK